MSWRFPEVRFVKGNSATKQVLHVLSEAEEVKEVALYEVGYVTFSDYLDMSRLDEEMVDLYHSCETYFRIRNKEGCNIHKVFSQVIDKNRERGYYEKGEVGEYR